MRKLFTLLTLGVLLMYTPYLYAQKDTIRVQKDTTQLQKDTTDDIPPVKSYLKVGLNFLNDNAFVGRTDINPTPTLTAKINYNFKFGLYVSGTLDAITNRDNNKLDGGSVEIGYNYTEDDNLEWGTSFTKLFFNSTSTRVSSSLSSELNAYIDYDIAEIITPGLSVSYNFGKSGNKGDILINPSLSHDFLIEPVFGDNDKVLISPQVGLNIGSQNFYSEYIERKGVPRRANAVYFNALGDMKLLDYEITAPIIYISGKFSFSFIPTLAFAKDSLPKSTQNEINQSTAIEAIQPFKSNVFYFETGISFKF
jgi:hypothetical protein